MSNRPVEWGTDKFMRVYYQVPAGYLLQYYSIVLAVYGEYLSVCRTKTQAGYSLQYYPIVLTVYGEYFVSTLGYSIPSGCTSVRLQDARYLLESSEGEACEDLVFCVIVAAQLLNSFSVRSNFSKFWFRNVSCVSDMELVFCQLAQRMEV